MERDLIFLHPTGFEDPLVNQSPAGINHIKSFLAEHDKLKFELVSINHFGYDRNRNMVSNYFTKCINIYSRIKKSRLVIIYHSLAFTPFFILFFLFRSKIILQFNELYTDYTQTIWKRWVEKVYVRLFRKYILANTSLKKYISTNAKTVIRGGYLDIRLDMENKIMNKSHFVYSGRIDEMKMGNLSIAKHLINNKPANITLTFHIFGPDSEELRSFAQPYNSVEIFIDSNEGILGKTFYSASFGLVLQNPSNTFNNTSFPSKIYKYISYGITPICVETLTIQNSEISEYIRCIPQWDWKEILTVQTLKFTPAKLNVLKKERWIQVRSFLN